MIEAFFNEIDINNTIQQYYTFLNKNQVKDIITEILIDIFNYCVKNTTNETQNKEELNKLPNYFMIEKHNLIFRNTLTNAENNLEDIYKLSGTIFKIKIPGIDDNIYNRYLEILKIMKFKMKVLNIKNNLFEEIVNKKSGKIFKDIKDFNILISKLF